MPNRYERNLGPLTKQECCILQHSRVCVVGCGGLGGYVVEALARIGVGKLTVVDGDTFDVTNLNRQLLCVEANIGKSKANAAKSRVADINSQIYVRAEKAYLTGENAPALLAGCDVAVDALDNIPARRVLCEACETLDIPLVHGAVDGWRGQVAVIAPGSGAFARLYPPDAAQEERPCGSLSFAPAVVAAIEAAEAVKLLLHREDTLAGQMLSIDLAHVRFDTVRLV